MGILGSTALSFSCFTSVYQPDRGEGRYIDPQDHTEVTIQDQYQDLYGPRRRIASNDCVYC